MDLRVRLTAFPTGSFDEGVGEPEPTVHRAVYLLPTPCRKTASRLGLNGDGRPAAQNASVVSTRTAHGPAASSAAPCPAAASARREGTRA